MAEHPISASTGDFYQQDGSPCKYQRKGGVTNLWSLCGRHICAWPLSGKLRHNQDVLPGGQKKRGSFDQGWEETRGGKGTIKAALREKEENDSENNLHHSWGGQRKVARNLQGNRNTALMQSINLWKSCLMRTLFMHGWWLHWHCQKKEWQKDSFLTDSISYHPC